MRSFIRALLAVVSIAVPTMALADSDVLRLGYQTGDINTLTLYADAVHLFDKVDLKVKLIPFPAGPAMLPALAASEIDLAWMGEFPIVTGYANGMPIEMIMIDRLNKTNVRLVASPASGINSLKDLKGKRIAVSIGSTSPSAHRPSLKDRRPQAGGRNSRQSSSPATCRPPMWQGRLMPSLPGNPISALSRKKGGKVIATTDSLNDITGVQLAARSEFTKAHPELVQKFLATWELATKAHDADPDEVRQYEAKRLGVSVPDFSAMLQRMTATYPTFKEQLTQPFTRCAPGKRCSPRMMIHLKDIGDFLLAEKRINAEPRDWSKIINTQPLQAYVAAKKN